MRQRELDALMKGLEKLTRTQRQRLVAELSGGERKAASVEVIERSLGDTPCCPHCAAERVVKNGSADGLQRYKCRACRRTFNALTGSPLAGLHMRGKWLDQAAVLTPILAKDAIFCSDGSKAMAAAARKMKIVHRPVNLSAGIRVIAGVYHVQNVNAYDSRLKDWLRRFKGVATQYLDSYLGWYRAIDRTPGGSLNPASLLAMAVRV